MILELRLSFENNFVRCGTKWDMAEGYVASSEYTIGIQVDFYCCVCLNTNQLARAQSWMFSAHGKLSFVFHSCHGQYA